jgi:hypothetical protein
MDAELMPLPLLGSSAWLGYKPTGVYWVSPTSLSLPLRGTRCVGLDDDLMPLPLRGSSAWLGYTPTGVYWGTRRLCPCHCEDQVRRAGCHADALPLRGSSAWRGYTPTGVYEGGPAGVPMYQGPEEVCLQYTESIPQSSTAQLLVSVWHLRHPYLCRGKPFWTLEWLVYGQSSAAIWSNPRSIQSQLLDPRGPTQR